MEHSYLYEGNSIVFHEQKREYYKITERFYDDYGDGCCYWLKPVSLYSIYYDHDVKTYLPVESAFGGYTTAKEDELTGVHIELLYAFRAHGQKYECFNFKCSVNSQESHRFFMNGNYECEGFADAVAFLERCKAELVDVIGQPD